MSKVSLQFPGGIGAVNVYVTDSAGAVVAEQQLLTPTRSQRTFNVDKPGRYIAYWQPIDGDVETFSFELADRDVALTIPLDDPGDVTREVRGQPFVRDHVSAKKVKKSAASARSAKSAAAKAKMPFREVWQQHFETAARSFAESRSKQAPRPSSVHSPYLARLKETSDTPTAELARSRQTDPEPRTDPRILIGFASDSRPLRRGGWRPYFAPWPIRVHTLGGLTFVINRDESTPVDPAGLDGSRVRFSVSCRGKPTTRFLVPLFAGGVAVSVRCVDPLSQELSFSILPTSPRSRVLIQALVSTSAQEARSITTDMEANAEHILGRLARNEDCDPWVAAVVGFINKRYGWDEDCSWSLRLREKFHWIIDTHILAAWWKSTPRGGSDFSTCLDYLASAGRLGAPYLADASATMSDLLVWMSSDLEDSSLRERARQELARWRQLIQFRGRAGASLTWFATKSHVSRSSDIIVYEGLFSGAFAPAAKTS